MMRKGFANTRLTVTAGAWNGQAIEASDHQLAFLQIEPGSPQHAYLNSLLRTAYWMGVNSESARMAKRLADIYTGRA